MSIGTWIRRGHRAMSMLFTACVIANFAAMGLIDGPPSGWVTYSPLLPLALLLFSGLYLFAEPHLSRGKLAR
jgi:hypothetical protein